MERELLDDTRDGGAGHGQRAGRDERDAEGKQVSNGDLDAATRILVTVGEFGIDGHCAATEGGPTFRGHIAVDAAAVIAQQAWEPVWQVEPCAIA